MTFFKNIALYVSIIKLVRIIVEIDKGQPPVSVASCLLWAIAYFVLDAIIND